MVEVIGYGEDALTLWALAHRLDDILRPGDDPSRCRLFFRPSFGRRAGAYSAQFGEFDFLILAGRHIYLGESKWVQAQPRPNDKWQLASPQDVRHIALRAYVERAFAIDPRDSAFFDPDVSLYYQMPMPRPDSLLASNLRTVLGAIRDRYAAAGSTPELWDVMLLFHKGLDLGETREPGERARIVPIDYTQAAEDVDAAGHLIELEIG